MTGVQTCALPISIKNKKRFDDGFVDGYRFKVELMEELGLE